MARCLALPNIEVRGIGTNLACRNGVVPDDRNMGELSDLADSIEAEFGITLGVVSGGNSVEPRVVALDRRTVGRIDNLRLGRSRSCSAATRSTAADRRDCTRTR